MAWSARHEMTAAAMRARAELYLVDLRSNVPDRYRELLNEIAARHGIRIRDILSSNNSALVVGARKEAAAALRELGLSYPTIGAILRKHHTSILHYLGKGSSTHSQRIASLEATVESLRCEIEVLKAR